MTVTRWNWSQKGIQRCTENLIVLVARRLPRPPAVYVEDVCKHSYFLLRRGETVKSVTQTRKETFFPTSNCSHLQATKANTRRVLVQHPLCNQWGTNIFPEQMEVASELPSVSTRGLGLTLLNKIDMKFQYRHEVRFSVSPSWCLVSKTKQSSAKCSTTELH